MTYDPSGGGGRGRTGRGVHVSPFKVVWATGYPSLRAKKRGCLAVILAVKGRLEWGKGGGSMKTTTQSRRVIRLVHSLSIVSVCFILHEKSCARAGSVFVGSETSCYGIIE